VCSSRLGRAKLGRWRFLYCPKCRGLLLDGESLLGLVLYYRRDSKEPYRDPRPIDPKDLLRQVICPTCGKPMQVHPYYGPGDFVIDSCAGCRQVWLDAGELNRAAEVKWGGSLWR